MALGRRHRRIINMMEAINYKKQVKSNAVRHEQVSSHRSTLDTTVNEVPCGGGYVVVLQYLPRFVQHIQKFTIFPST